MLFRSCWPFVITDKHIQLRAAGCGILNPLDIRINTKRNIPNIVKGNIIPTKKVRVAKYLVVKSRPEAKTTEQIQNII